MLFSVALHSIYSAPVCRFAAWYLDDATLGGSTDTVKEELDRVKNNCSERGLELNTTKSKLFRRTPTSAKRSSPAARSRVHRKLNYSALPSAPRLR